MFAEDANEMVIRIAEQAKSMGEEIDIQDGFDLYKALSTIRRLYTSTIPEYVSIPCHVLATRLMDIVPLSLSMLKVFSRSLYGAGCVLPIKVSWSG